MCMIGGVSMDSNIVSLRDFIDSNDQNKSAKIQTFCRLMKKVSDAIDKEPRALVKINLDDIKINKYSGDIIFPPYIYADNQLDKTMANFNTGISLMADRKSSVEHKRVSFALMLLGWYCNDDKSAINSDITVLENFDLYMSKVPNWLKGFFINVFRKMDYNISFSDYYKNNFTDVVNEEVKRAFSNYNLSDEQLSKIKNLIILETNKLIKEGDLIG